MNLLALALLQSFSLGAPVAPPASPAISVGLRTAVVEVVIASTLSAETQLGNAPSLALTAAEYPSAWPRAFETRATGKYFGARYFSSKVGRFTTIDPVFTWKDNLVDPQRWNRYAYVRNNPLKYVDPDGRAIDVIADVGFILYDIFDIGRSAFRGEGPSGVQMGALGADILGAAIPFATGGGAALRAANKVDKAIDSSKAIQVQRAMSRAELEATQATGLLRGGREGTHFVSDAVNSSANRARQRLALGQKPEVRVTMEVPAGRFSPPSKVAPANGLPGGGTERTASGAVPAKVLRVDEMKK